MISATTPNSKPENWLRGPVAGACARGASAGASVARSLCCHSNTARRAARMPRSDRDHRGQAASSSVCSRGFGRRAWIAGTSGVAAAPGSCRLNFTGAFMTEPYVRPPGVGLLFASLAEIEAAPAAEREAYLRIVEAILADPSCCDMRRENAEDLARESASDARIAGINNDWVS